MSQETCEELGESVQSVTKKAETVEYGFEESSDNPGNPGNPVGAQGSGVKPFRGLSLRMKLVIAGVMVCIVLIVSAYMMFRAS